ncbi:uncharacterized protein LOC141587548 [Silene latifolia]|uniref:uncharacterized protein LOC141587548 n=1 Tax=Silene latifolia TaxID=37657 RepID=UPI003D76EFF3
MSTSSAKSRISLQDVLAQKVKEQVTAVPKPAEKRKSTPAPGSGPRPKRRSAAVDRAKEQVPIEATPLAVRPPLPGHGLSASEDVLTSKAVPGADSTRPASDAVPTPETIPASGGISKVAPASGATSASGAIPASRATSASKTVPASGAASGSKSAPASGATSGSKSAPGVIVFSLPDNFGRNKSTSSLDLMSQMLLPAPRSALDSAPLSDLVDRATEHSFESFQMALYLREKVSLLVAENAKLLRREGGQ